MVQQHVPQRLPAEDLGVAQDHQAILGPGQSHIQPPGITQEPNALHRPADVFPFGGFEVGRHAMLSEVETQ